jgi:hypothetical protein
MLGPRFEPQQSRDAVPERLLQATVHNKTDCSDCGDSNNKRHKHPTDSVNFCRALRVIRLVKIGHRDFSHGRHHPKAA